MSSTLEICHDCGHATDTPPSSGRCRECGAMQSYDNVEVCPHGYGNAWEASDLCEACLFMWKRSLTMSATKGRSLAIREAAQRKDLANA